MKGTRWSDKRLARRAGQGDQAACAELVRSHYQSVFRFVYHLCDDWQLAEDITQETFAAGWKRIGSFDGRCTLATWLYRIARNKLVDSHRRRKPTAEAIEAAEHNSPTNDGPLRTLMADEESRLLHKSVAALDGVSREMIVLHYFQGLSYREMAGILDKRPGTVKWLTSRALEQLRTQMNRRHDHD